MTLARTVMTTVTVTLMMLSRGAITLDHRPDTLLL
jgi:hypothetical protein